MVSKGWEPDIIIGRAERLISYSVSIFYRRFKQDEFNVLQLPMKSKRKINDHQERRGKKECKGNISEREKNHADFVIEIWHL